MGLVASFTQRDSKKRRIALALALYALATVVYFACAPRDKLIQHTSFNHYALLADGWLHRRLDLGGSPPPYTQNNDFAQYRGKWFVSFPPFPAVLLLPFAALAKTPDNLRDGQAFLWLAGIGPAVLFLCLEKLRRTGKSDRTELVDVALSLLFAFGTVYFFTAEQGTVWFAAHVVGVGLAAIYLLFALDAENPALAGLAIALAFVTRALPIALAAVFFGIEALRVSAGGTFPAYGTLRQRITMTWIATDGRALARRLAGYVAPIAVVLGITFWHNYARFGHITEFGHNLLTVGWRGRIDRWGLFSFHYLARNLGIVLTSLPYLNQVPAKVQINTHGLALWVTTPAYLWLLWPRKTSALWWSLALTAGLVASADLLYQNSGWLQFGYRFSNDYAVFLFAMLAIGGFRFGKFFWACALWAVGVNAFGALTFDRGLEKFYYTDSSQKTIYQPD